MASKPKKISLEQLFRLVEQLPPAEQEKLRLKLNNKTGEQPSTSSHLFLDWQIDIDCLADQQGISEGTSVENLKGNFWPEDEDPDEFIRALRQWRQEDIGPN